MSENQQKESQVEEFHTVAELPGGLFFPALWLRIGSLVDGITSAYRRWVGIDIDDAVNIYWKRANIAQLRGEYDEAVAILKRLARLEPRDAEVHYVMGLNFEKMCKYEEAVRCYQDTVRLRPGHADACLRLGIVLSQSDFDGEAIPYLKRAVELNSGSKEAFFYLGMAYDN